MFDFLGLNYMGFDKGMVPNQEELKNFFLAASKYGEKELSSALKILKIFGASLTEGNLDIALGLVEDFSFQGEGANA